MIRIKYFLSNAYIASTLGTAAILFALRNLQFVFGGSPPLLLFLIVIAFAAWYGGLKTGLFTTVLSATASAYFLIEPYDSFNIARSSEILRIMLLVSVGAIFSLIIALLHNQEKRALQTVMEREDQLKQENAKRNQTQTERNLYISLAKSSSEFIGMCDTEGVPFFINDAGLSLVGLDNLEQGLKTPVKEFFFPEDQAFIEDDFFPAVFQNGRGEVEIRFRHFKTGETLWMIYNVFALKDLNDKIVGLGTVSTNITERKSAEEEVKQLAFYDLLTKLPNRRLLQERLKHSIDVERREDKQLALLMLDLDRFKSVNDSLGHLAGDKLLQQVAARITSRLRNVDMVARLGGDEFIVLLEDIAHPDDAARVAEEIITDLSKPFKVTQSDDVRIGVSIGISLYPQHGDNAEILLNHADAALYHVKGQGRGCFAYFSEDLTIAARERIELENRLRRAIQQQELRVFYQPQIDIASGRIIGAEALVHWQDPIAGLIPPSRFIPIAEETSLIVELGEWVLRETCKQGRQWLDMGLPPLTMAVNVSSHQFHRNDINAVVTKVLAETRFPARQLELEITESGLMANQNKTTAILNSLHVQGVRIAIDDFGTGYSSLAYLKRFSLDVLKIDKSFIDEIPYNTDDMEIAATIVAMGHTLGFKVLAEGVETPEQLDFLRKTGCDSYQGFIKSGPLLAEKFAELLRDQRG